MRAELLSAITSAISTLTNFAVSLELPWEQNGQPLFRKNMRKIYLDQEYRNETTLIPVLDGGNILEDEIVVEAYLAVDAKNTPSGLDNLISKVLAAKNSTGLVNFIVESDYTVDKQEDVLILTFEFRMKTIKQ